MSDPELPETNLVLDDEGPTGLSSSDMSPRLERHESRLLLDQERPAKRPWYLFRPVFIAIGVAVIIIVATLVILAVVLTRKPTGALLLPFAVNTDRTI